MGSLAADCGCREVHVRGRQGGHQRDAGAHRTRPSVRRGGTRPRGLREVARRHCRGRYRHAQGVSCAGGGHRQPAHQVSDGRRRLRRADARIAQDGRPRRAAHVRDVRRDDPRADPHWPLAQRHLAVGGPRHTPLPPGHEADGAGVPRFVVRLPRRLLRARGHGRYRRIRGRIQGHHASVRLPGRRLLFARLLRRGRVREGVRREEGDEVLPADCHWSNHHWHRPRPRAGGR